ncbi:GDSL esterase/lipase-like protein [Tanacetum coccineum]
MSYASKRLFDQMPDPNTALCNSIFKGFIANEMYIDVMLLFGQMVNSNVRGDYFTMPMVLKACAKVSGLRDGGKVHCVVVKDGFLAKSFVGTALIDMYCSGGNVGCGYKVFREIGFRNVVTWTSMIRYIDCGDMVGARKLFDVMPNRDLMSWNTLLNGYTNNKDMEGCKKLFDEMPERNIFSWNGLINGYAHNGRFLEVLDTFKMMLNESDVKPNDATFVSVLSACSKLGALELGKWVHVYAANNRYKQNPYVGNSLIDMYAKCGVITSAIEPENPFHYVMLSNICGDAKRWNDLARSKVAMRNTGAKKLPGGSLIEVDDGVVEFYAFDERHSKTEDIYSALRSLIKLSKAFGFCFCLGLTGMMPYEKDVAKVVIALTILLMLGTCLAKTLTCNFVFGDSLVEVGNNNYIVSLSKANYVPNGIDFGRPTGRYTNGRTIELGLKDFTPPYLAPTTTGPLLLKGVNYASGGGGILNQTGKIFVGRINMDAQLDNFANTRQDIITQIGLPATQDLLSGALFTVVIGSNDFLNNYLLPVISTVERKLVSPEAFVRELIARFRGQLKRLYDMGARKIIVPNVGPIGCIPYQRDVNPSSGGNCVASSNHLAQNFNSQLKGLLQELTNTLEGSTFVYANINRIVEDIIRNYQSYGFTNADSACCYVTGRHGGIVPCAPPSKVCYDTSKYVFWDPYHTSESANIILAKRLLEGGNEDISPMNVRALLKS